MNAAAEPLLVALRLPPGPEWVATAAAIWAEGNAVLPLALTEPAAVTQRALAALRPSLLVDDHGTHTLSDGVPVAAGTSVVLATSGSTGTPKGVVLSDAALRTAARLSVARLGATADDRWLSCLPLNHVAGLLVLLRAEVTGAAPVIHDGFSVEAVAAERGVTMVALVPTMLRRLLDAGADLRHLRRVVLGGAAPGTQLLDDARRAGVDVVTTYGMTETAGGCVYDGEPLDGVSVRIDDDGRIWLATPTLFDGYRLRDDLTLAKLRDGWLRTDDVGRWTDDGRLEIVGRADDVIITGGENVAAAWVADILQRHPAVAEAAVVGRPDPEWGQRIVAFVVPRGRAPTVDELRGFAREHAPVHAAPREVVIVDDLPRLSSGKVDRQALLDLR